MSPRSEAGFRFALGLVLWATGFTLVRAVVAYLLSSLLRLAGYALCLPIDWRRFFASRLGLRETTITRRAYITGAAFCLLAALTQVDMIAAKHYLAADVAGHYAAACTLTKTPFLLLAGSFASVMFPSVVRTGSTTSEGLKLLAQTLGLVGGGIGLVVVVCSLLPEQIVTLLMGAEFRPLADWLPIFALLACAPGLLSVVARYYMVSHGSLLVPWLAIGLAAVVGSLALFHDSELHIAAAMAIGSGVPLLALWAHGAVLAMRVSPRTD
ncbi:MAG: hypothetical protein ACP5KN_03715 [Armatimonadota bacterium]